MDSVYYSQRQWLLKKTAKACMILTLLFLDLVKAQRGVDIIARVTFVFPPTKARSLFNSGCYGFGQKCCAFLFMLPTRNQWIRVTGAGVIQKPLFPQSIPAEVTSSPHRALCFVSLIFMTAF